jgi:aminomethyltransferase
VLREESGGRDATADDVSAAFAVLAVEGPEAGRVMDRLFGKGPLPASALCAVEREFEKFSILVMRASATGEDGFHVMVPTADVPRIRDYLVQAARGSDGLPVGLSAWNVRRVEAGLPWYGIDFTTEDYPDDVRLGAAVRSTEGAFRGKEALTGPGAGGHAGRALVGLVAEDESYAVRAPDGDDTDLRGPLPIGSPIHLRRSVRAEHERSSTEPAGFVTSSVKSPALGRPLFMGSVRRELLGDDRGYFVDTPHGALSLRAIELPLHKTGF